ncbi:ATP-binding protein [Corynebacterium choanae]|uniref:Magnesium-chelatase 38 kDa subunit n=1 Tax=Corynebacterium choanae TaxID=1862358 RepID=A0A3G6J780_9CORY|nr:AAA family ATPase [Corynebacterium choanae]AZA13836.1 Magnesium-chelatase 38 kDa subunit [Corynebacterium choanae]
MELTVTQDHLSGSKRVAAYPFSAVVGQDDLRLALMLTAINPRIGGVVIRGEKGTAKTTAVRGFAALLGDAPLVQLPLGATEDRVVGSLDMETVLTTGRAEYKPGLLAQADGGILYVDEVNLLADHLVDALLDAAATGQVTIERDSISHTTDTNFVLVGTMNPEEGELRPQLLDRFGLAVDVVASRDVNVRTEIMRRRLAFEADPAGFAARFAEADAGLAQQLTAARERVDSVVLSAAHLARIAHVCAAFDVDGMRADLVIARAAVAHAALAGRQQVEDEDIHVAARLALPHRRRRTPFDEPGLDEQQLAEELANAADEHPEVEDETPETQNPTEQDSPEQPDDDAGSDDAPGGSREQSSSPADESLSTSPSPASDDAEQPGKASGHAVTGAPFRAAADAPRRNR